MHQRTERTRRAAGRSKLNAIWLVLVATTWAADARAQVVGAPGTPGLRGLLGVNGGDGGAGGPGGDVTLLDVVTNDWNRVSATGGRGGDGGRGTSPDGDGGNGGAGGAASATATTTNDSALFHGSTIDAVGGAGGDGGEPSRSPISVGGSGGTGGAATARATEIGAGPVARALGGQGGNGTGIASRGGDGGDALVEIEGRSVGDDDLQMQATATGGQGGTTSFGALVGDGGDARVVASGSGTGSGQVRVNVRAVGGAAGRWFPFDPSREAVGGVAGTADAQAYGESTGGGYVQVWVFARGGDAWRGPGGSVRQFDAATGRTSGFLELVQSATGGDSEFGRGGDAESSLSRRDDEAVSLRLAAVARGGRGPEGGGNALASAQGIGRGDVSVEASAGAGEGGAGGPSGRAQLGPIYGESLGGGRVEVTGSLVGVSGAAIATDSRDASPDVLLDAIVDGAVEGRTTGTLSLSQGAVGGDAIAGAIGAGPIARAGSALDRLERHVSASQLEVVLASRGGAGKWLNEQNAPSSDGGNAATVARLSNDVGGIYFQGMADGGVAGFGKRGGDASLDVEVETQEDGADIFIAPARIKAGDSYEYGTSQGGEGGDATSRSIATASGDGAVDVSDLAEGGMGVQGGDASSFARGANAGSRSVFVHAMANAGSSVDRVLADWGSARAEAHGYSPGGAVEVESTASSQGGFESNLLSPQWLLGSAVAVASADGRESRVRADANGVTGAFGELGIPLRAGAYGEGSGAIDARAVVGTDPSPAPSGGSDPRVSIVADGLHARAGEWGRGVLDIHAERADTDIVLGGELELSHDARENPSDAIFVSFLDVRLDDDDFGTLVVRIAQDDVPLLERSFDDAASARAFLAASVSIADLLAGLPTDFRYTSRLEISIEGRGVSEGTDFHLAIAVGRSAIPEPGSASLILLGLLILGCRRSPR